jgi:hypothetical protein
MRNSGEGRLWSVLTGFVLGAAVTVGALWGTKSDVRDLARPSTDSPSLENLKAKAQAAEVACKRQFPNDPDGAYVCYMVLAERLQAEFERGVATQYDGGTARAALEAGIR